MKGIENSKNLLVGDLIIKNKSDIYNSAVLIAEDGKITSSYHKDHIVPFG